MNAPTDPALQERTAALQGMGDSRLRKEDARFIQGKGNYVDDIKLPGMLHMDIVRSPLAHARIKRIDKSEALKVPGVLAVITAAHVCKERVGRGDRLAAQLAGRVLHRLDDVLVAGAAAQIARDAPANLFLTGRWILLQKDIRRHQHARCAVAALQPVLLFESFLQRMKHAIFAEAFDSHQFAAIGLYRKHGAGLDELTVKHDGAGPAMGCVAADVRARESGNAAYEVHQQQSRFNHGFANPSVDLDLNQLL